MLKLNLVLAAALAIGSGSCPAEQKSPVRFAIFGLSHDHAAGFIPRTRNRQDIQLVGIVEPNQDLVARYAKQFQLGSNLFYPNLETLLARTNPQAVATFTS